MSGAERGRIFPVAVLVPVCYFGGLIVGGLLHPGFSHLQQLPSELGAIGAPFRFVYNASLVLTGLSFLLTALAYGAAVRRLGAGPAWGWAVTVSLAIPGLYFGFVGVVSLPDPMHNAAFPLLLPAQVAPFLLAKAIWHRPNLRPVAGYLIATGLVMLVLLAMAFGVGGLVSSRNQGLFIRVYALAAFVWIGVAGYLLDRRARGSGSSPGRPG